MCIYSHVHIAADLLLSYEASINGHKSHIYLSIQIRKLGGKILMQKAISRVLLVLSYRLYETYLEGLTFINKLDHT